MQDSRELDYLNDDILSSFSLKRSPSMTNVMTNAKGCQVSKPLKFNKKALDNIRKKSSLGIKN